MAKGTKNTKSFEQTLWDTADKLQPYKFPLLFLASFTLFV